MNLKEYIEQEVNEELQKDGGGCDYVSFEEGVLTIRLKGACTDCPFSTMTLKEGIETVVKEEFPEVVSVENIE